MPVGSVEEVSKRDGKTRHRRYSKVRLEHSGDIMQTLREQIVAANIAGEKSLKIVEAITQQINIVQSIAEQTDLLRA